MAATHSDEMLVAEFLELKRRLNARSGEDPSRIQARLADDPELRELCRGIYDVAMQLEHHELFEPAGLIEPVNRAFVREWRDYAERFEGAVASVFLDDLGFQTAGHPRSTLEENVDYMAVERAEDIEALFAYARDRRHDAMDETLEGLFGNAEHAWFVLREMTSLDLRGIFRRCELAPRMLVPADVAAKVGGTRKVSLYDKWVDARRAYIFGAHLSAWGMIRGILESVLHDIYGASGRTLHDSIRSIKREMPVGMTTEAFDRIRIVAKFVLHAKQEFGDDLIKHKEKKIADEALMSGEAGIRLALLELRRLVEEAPEK